MDITPNHNDHFFIPKGLEAGKKRAELQRYFPGLYDKSKAQRSVGAEQGGPWSKRPDFAEHLNDVISKEKIKKEIRQDPQKKKLYNAALEFQAIFIDKMLAAMRKNLNPKNDLLYGGFRQKIFEDMLYEEYSRKLSKTDNFHLADSIYRQLRPALSGGGNAVKLKQ